MRPLDLLDHLGSTSAVVGFIATYEFDPQFFERRLLPTKSLSQAERLVIFMDQGRYQSLIDSDLNVRGFNRHYLVIPISRAPYVFHPKLYLTVGQKRVDAIVGSSNCTNAGFAYNLELCSSFSVSHDAQQRDVRDQASLIRQVYDLLKSFAEKAGPFKELLAKQFFAKAEEYAPWLAKNVMLPPGEIELLHTDTRPLWHEVVKRLEGKAVRGVTVISPFYDRNLGLLKNFREQWPKATLTVVAQPQYATLTGKLLAPLFAGGKHKLFAATPQPGRNLHAKAFAFETKDGCYWLCGSANASQAAFEGHNTETGIWLKTREDALHLLNESKLTLEKIDPKSFKSGRAEEPRNLQRQSALSLDSAVLHDNGTLECAASVLDGIGDLTLALRNFNEKFPFVSTAIERRTSNGFSIELSQTQLDQVRATAFCWLKGVTRTGEVVQSNAVAVAQVEHILRDNYDGRGGGNARKRIEETGENLVGYVDGLADVREAIEFFANVSIRFHDGELSSRGMPGEGWKPRDPFTPDTPPDWLNIPLGASEADLRAAIVTFVERHQHDKLLRHVRRGNLNGLPNFLDIFRTLNSVLFAYNARVMSGATAVIPSPFVTHHVMKNIEYLIGTFEPGEGRDSDDLGFIASIYSNFAGDKALVRERLQEEHVPQMILAAVQAMIRVRAIAQKKRGLDDWAAKRVNWVKSWINAQGLASPIHEQVKIAAREYAPATKAA